uniref:Uncharacterized protein n=1 Tax=Glossina palpalis gambiensis TaxID=67801 RepID=A0A1B0BP76_9MUSC
MEGGAMTLRRTLSLDASDDARNDDLKDLWRPYWRREQPYDTNRSEHDVDDDKANDNWNDDDQYTRKSNAKMVHVLGQFEINVITISQDMLN